MKLRLFWKLGLTYLALLLAVLLAIDLYSSRVLRGDYLRTAEAQLGSLTRLTQSRPPRVDDSAGLASWAAWMAQSGARVTVIATDGRVLADSARDPETMENHANRPEFQQAMANGEGGSVRHSHTLDRDLVYHAIRFQPAAGPPVVIRLAVPLAQIDKALGDIRQRLWTASLLILLLGGVISLLLSRAFSARIERLKRFAGRVALGDFQPLPPDHSGDELADLARALNDTATRLSQTIRSLTDERNRSAAILRSMAEGVAVIDAQERIIFCNRAFCEILDLDPLWCEGHPLLEAVRQWDLVAVIRKALAGQQALQSEVSVGTLRPRSFSVTAAPVPAPTAGQAQAEFAGQGQGAVVVLHDISELRRLERVRRDFVANVSHEFKTPLTAIQGFAETLLAGALEDRRNSRRFLEIIRDHASRLGRLTDDLLKLSLIEAGKLELDIQPIALADLVAACVETSRFQANQKQLVLEVKCPSQLPRVKGDAGRLREVLQNLLDNAVQYTPTGGRILVSAALQDQRMVITVADTGIGIPEAEQGRIFERFYRVDAARSREVGGTGLGLAIAKHIVEAHGGRIWVESAIGQGSKFHFSIPLAP